METQVHPKLVLPDTKRGLVKLSDGSTSLPAKGF